MARFLSSTEVSLLLGVSAASVKRWADAGRLHCILTPGRHRRFTQQEVERFRQAQATLTGQVSGWADRLLSVHGSAGLQGALLEERSRRGTWWQVAEELEPVIAELARRVAIVEITGVEGLVAGELLYRALQQCAATPPRTGTPCALLVRPEFDHTRLGLALVELCAGDLGWATQIVGSVEGAELRRHLERHAPSAVVLAVGLGCDPLRVGPYVTALRSDCGRLGIPFAFVGNFHEASAAATPADGGMDALRNWMETLKAVLAALPAPPAGAVGVATPPAPGR
jgi:excisionase family DNA binding protein